MPRLICLVEHYGSFDNGASFVVAQGDEFEVSAEKAAQMLTDFPDWFRRADRPATAPKTRTRPAPQKGA
mgnify:CR=1 FL=1